MRERFVDLHVHTYFSDSTSSPSEVVARAVKEGFSAIAITDHDNIDGITPTIKVARNFPLEIVPGIELTSEVDGLEVHILGYFFDYKSEKLAKRLSAIKEARIKRIFEMCSRLKDLGVSIEPKEVFDLAGRGSVGRLHLARVLLQKGFIASIAEAFYKYIGDKCPAYVARFYLSPQEAISLIKELGGLAVLAHPYILSNDDLIVEFIQAGLRGIEVYYPEHSTKVKEHFKELAYKHGLLITGGSDCHGSAKQQILMGKIKLPYEFLEKMKQELGLT